MKEIKLELYNPRKLMNEIQPIKDMIDKTVANTSDELLENILMKNLFTKEEISLALRKGIEKH